MFDFEHDPVWLFALYEFISDDDDTDDTVEPELTLELSFTFEDVDDEA